MNNLKMLRKKHRLTQQQIAEKIGINQNTYSYWENGKVKVNQEDLSFLADFYGVSVDFLLGLEKPLDTVKGSVQIPVIGVVPAGVPIEAIQEFIDEYQDIPAALARTGDYFGLKIKGDSMYPYYMEGDTVIVKKQSDVESGDKAIVIVNGFDATCKTVQKTDNGIRLVPYNVAHPPKEYTFEEIEKLPVSIIGKVVEVRREEK